MAQAQPAAQHMGQPSSTEMPSGGAGSELLLQTPSPPDCGRPAHDSGSPRPCRVPADGSGARGGVARRGSIASRVSKAEAQLLTLLGESGKADGGGDTAHVDSPATAAAAACSLPSPPAAAAGDSRTVPRRRTTDDAPAHTVTKRDGGLGSLTATARVPPPVTARAADHRGPEASTEERVLARRACSDGVAGAAGLSALGSNNSPESSPSQVRSTGTRSALRSSTSELHHRRRTVGDVALHQQARHRAHTAFCTAPRIFRLTKQRTLSAPRLHAPA